MRGDYYTNNPVRDMENHYRDDRRIVGWCDECGEAIHGGTDGEYGDEIFVREGIMVHIDCLSAWTKNFIKEVE